MTLRFSNLTKFGVWVFALAAVVHALNDILTDSESDSDELLYSIIEDSYYTWRNSQDVLNAKKGAGSSCISVAVFIVVLLVALLIGSGSALGVGYFFFYKKKMTAKEEEIEKLTKQIGVKAEDIETLETQIATLKASPSNTAGSSNSGDAPDPTEIARLETEVQNLEEKIVEMTKELDGLREELVQAKIHPPPPAGPSNQDLEDAKTENGRLVNLVADLTRQLNEALGLENNDANSANLPRPSLPLPGASDQELENANAQLQESVDELTRLLQAARQANNSANVTIQHLRDVNSQLRDQLYQPNEHASDQLGHGNNGHIQGSGQPNDPIVHPPLDAYVAPPGDFYVPANDFDTSGQLGHDNTGGIHGSEVQDDPFRGNQPHGQPTVEFPLPGIDFGASGQLGHDNTGGIERSMHQNGPFSDSSHG
eukprot:318573_1